MDFEKVIAGIERQAAEEKNLSHYHRSMGFESSIPDAPVTMADLHGHVSCVLQALAFNLRSALVAARTPTQESETDG